MLEVTAYFSGLAFSAAALITWWLIHARGVFQAMDHPNERSLHTSVTPRTGGIAIMSAVIGTVAIAWNQEIGALLGLSEVMAFLLLLLVSYLDDHVNLPALARFLVMIFVSLWVLIANDVAFFSHNWVGIFAFGFLLWCINVYNFMDGMDGLAGGMAIIGYATFSIAAMLAGDAGFVFFCWIMVASTAGFLLFNFPPARIFMGDVGAVPLGFLTGLLILYAHRENILPFWLGILVFSPFIFDASVTLLRRIRQGERFWEAHKTHYYQRLVQLGWSQRRTLSFEYLLMLACGLSALWALHLSVFQQFLILVFWVVVYSYLTLQIRRMERQV